MSGSYDGLRVVVTGGTGGLGSPVVRAFLDAGAICHVPGRDAGAGDAEWASHPRARYHGGVDLTDEKAVAAFYGSVGGHWASVQLAGGFAMGPFAETSLETLRRQLDINLVTCFLACREAARSMLAARKGGRIVNVASRPALVPAAGLSAYAASKAAVACLTTSIAEELKDAGILVNAVVPSIIDTPANRKAMPKADVSRWPTPAELSKTILFLASPENTLTQGALVPVYGSA